MPLRSRGPALLGGARDSALHFAGRKPELAALRECLHYIMATGSARGGTALVDGPQGVNVTIRWGLAGSREPTSKVLDTCDAKLQREEKS